MDGYNRLMISVLATQLKDYLSFCKRKKEQAEVYLFDDSKESDDYVLGFKFICKHIGIDPLRFRKKIKSIRKEDIKEILGKAKK